MLSMYSLPEILETFCPYGQVSSQPDATYEQINAAIGFKASPAIGLWLNLYGGYQNLKDDLFFQPADFESAANEYSPMLSIANCSVCLSML